MKLFKLLAAAILAVSLVGCGGHQVKSIAAQKVVSVSDVKVSKSLVKDAIIKAGIHRGWIMQEISDGVISGKLNVRKHYAEIEITYTADAYTITYVDSRGIAYDPYRHTIHRQYNNWITYLDRSIQVYLNRLQLGE